MGGCGFSAPTSGYRLNKQDVEQAIFNRVLVAIAVIQLLNLWHMALVITQDIFPLALSLVAALVLLALHWVSQRSFPIAKFGLVGACVFGIVAVQHGRWGASWLLAVPVLVAGALYTPVVALVLALLSACFIEFCLPGVTVLPSFLVIATGVLSWLTLQPLHRLLQWHSRRNFEATALAEQLRDQRGKLNRTIKALDDSYRLLEKTNRELLLARQEADMLRDLRSRFATNLSHELRTPLNIILGFSQLIYTKPQLYGYDKWSAALLRDLAEVRRNAGYLSQLVDDIVDLARVDALAMPMRRELTHLRHVIDEAVATAKSLPLGSRVSIGVSCPSDIPALYIDPIRIRQVLFNLLTNALRHTEAGSVTIDVQGRDGEVVVSVRDTGCGIPQEQLTTIFNEFYQLGSPKGDVDSGKGLGLAIAKRFVQLHGGRIWAESQVGQGSTFLFSLPLAHCSVSLSKQTTPLPLPKLRDKPLVAVLSEDGLAASYLRRRVEEAEFVAVETAEELAATVSVDNVAAVIVDSAMTPNDEATVQELLRQSPTSIPLIECALPSGRWLSGEERFSAVLTKPVTQETLLAAVAKVTPQVGQPRILVVDDDRSFVQLVKRLLQSSDTTYEVLTAYGGAEALRKARQVRPDAVLLDLLMPDTSGFDVLSQMRMSPDLQEVPVIALTATTPGEDRMLEEGARFAFAKREAFRPGELARLISAALELATGPIEMRRPDSL